MMELDEILNGPNEAPPPAPEPPPPPEPADTGEPPAPEPKDDRPRDEHGRFAPKPKDEGTPDAAPPAAKPDHGPIPIQALLDEREKRQALQRERDEYARQLQYFQHLQRQQPPPQRPSVLENPDGALDYVQQQVAQQVQAARLDMSVSLARSQWPDYDQAEDAFIRVARLNKALGEQMAQDPHPAAFAYKMGRQFLAMQEIGDPVSYKDRVVDDDALFERMLEKRGLSLQQVQSPAPQPPAPAFPSSLSTARAAAPRQPTSAYTGPTPLSALGNPGLRMG